MVESGSVIAYLLLIGLFLGFGYLFIPPYFPPPPEPIAGTWQNITENSNYGFIIHSDGKFEAPVYTVSDNGLPHSATPRDQEGTWKKESDGTYNFTAKSGWIRILAYFPSQDILYEKELNRTYFRKNTSVKFYTIIHE